MSYARAGRRQELSIDGGPGRAAEGPEGLHDRRQAACRGSTFRPRSSAASTYMQDVKVPGHAARARWSSPQAMQAQRSKASTTPPCQADPRLSSRAVRKGNFLAVVATNEWARHQRVDRDQSPSGRTWAGLPDQAKLFEYVRSSEGRTATRCSSKVGDIGRGLATRGAKVVAGDLRLRRCNTHGSIGPSCAVADFKDGQLTVVDAVAGDATCCASSWRPCCS